jgi:hypothetical protein
MSAKHTPGSLSNYETALRAEAKRVVRTFHHYSADQRSTLACHRRTARSRKALDGGEFFYSHPDVPGICFHKRFEAARAAISKATAT